MEMPLLAGKLSVELAREADPGSIFVCEAEKQNACQVLEQISSTVPQLTHLWRGNFEDGVQLPELPELEGALHIMQE